MLFILPFFKNFAKHTFLSEEYVQIRFEIELKNNI